MASLACVAALGLAGCGSDPKAALAKCEKNAARDAVAEWQADILLRLCQEEFAKNAPHFALSSEELEEGTRDFDATLPQTATNPTTGERLALINNQWVPITLTAIRRRYPQYNDMSDIELAEVLHRKFYSGLSKEQAFNRLGVAPLQGTPVPTPAPAEPAEEEKQSWGEWFSEMPL